MPCTNFTIKATWTEGRICSFDPVVFHSFKFAPLWVLWLFHQRIAGLIWRLALPWEDSQWDAAATWSTTHPLIAVSWPSICLQGSWSLYCRVIVLFMQWAREEEKNSQKINYCWKFFWFSTPWSSSHSFTRDQASQHLQVGLPWNFLLTFKVPQMIHSAFGVYRRIKFHVDETYL